jgi:hypothetical protein
VTFALGEHADTGADLGSLQSADALLAGVPSVSLRAVAVLDFSSKRNHCAMIAQFNKKIAPQEKLRKQT